MVYCVDYFMDAVSQDVSDEEDHYFGACFGCRVLASPAAHFAGQVSDGDNGQ